MGADGDDFLGGAFGHVLGEFGGEGEGDAVAAAFRDEGEVLGFHEGDVGKNAVDQRAEVGFVDVGVDHLEEMQGVFGEAGKRTLTSAGTSASVRALLTSYLRSLSWP